MNHSFRLKINYFFLNLNQVYQHGYNYYSDIMRNKFQWSHSLKNLSLAKNYLILALNRKLTKVCQSVSVSIQLLLPNFQV